MLRVRTNREMVVASCAFVLLLTNRPDFSQPITGDILGLQRGFSMEASKSAR